MNTTDLCKQAGLIVGTNISGVTLVGASAEIGLAHITLGEMERLVQIVRNATLEEAAKECEHTAVRMGSEWMAHHCAAAIRAMKEQT